MAVSLVAWVRERVNRSMISGSSGGINAEYVSWMKCPLTMVSTCPSLKLDFLSSVGVERLVDVMLYPFARRAYEG